MGRVARRFGRGDAGQIAAHLNLDVAERRDGGAKPLQLAAAHERAAQHGQEPKTNRQCCHVTPNPLLQPARAAPFTMCTVGPPLTLMPQDSQTRSTMIASTSAAGSNDHAAVSSALPASTARLPGARVRSSYTRVPPALKRRAKSPRPAAR